MPFFRIFESTRSTKRKEDEAVFEQVRPLMDRLKEKLKEAEACVDNPEDLERSLIDIRSLFRLVKEELEKTAHGARYFREQTGSVRDSLEGAHHRAYYSDTPFEFFGEYETRFHVLERLYENYGQKSNLEND